MTTPLLWHFPISHYNEKVRWALDYKCIPHRREVLSASYLPRAWWATGAGHLPVLHLEDGAVGDSTAIIAAIEERWPEPPLYPKDPDQLRRALEIEDWFDEEIGHPARTLIVGPLMTEGGAERTAEVMMRGMGEGVRRLFRLAHPIFHRLYFWRHGVHDASRRKAPSAVASGFDRIAKEAGPAGYLVGDSFTVADLTAAALLAPVVRPKGTIWAEIGTLPGTAGRFVEELGDHPGVPWIHEMYRRHRGESAEIAS